MPKLSSTILDGYDVHGWSLCHGNRQQETEIINSYLFLPLKVRTKKNTFSFAYLFSIQLLASQSNMQVLFIGMLCLTSRNGSIWPIKKIFNQIML